MSRRSNRRRSGDVSDGVRGIGRHGAGRLAEDACDWRGMGDGRDWAGRRFRTANRVPNDAVLPLAVVLFVAAATAAWLHREELTLVGRRLQR